MCPSRPPGGKQGVHRDEYEQRCDVVQVDLPVEADAQRRSGEHDTREHGRRNAPGRPAHDLEHEERRENRHDEHKDPARVHGVVEGEKASHRLRPRTDKRPAERRMVVVVGVVRERALVEHAPRRTQVDTLVDLVLREVKDVVPGKDRRRGQHEQKGQPRGREETGDPAQPATAGPATVTRALTLREASSF